MATFGENLKRIRKEKKLTLRELANLMGVSASNISHYEQGERNPKPETMRKFKEALGCSFEDLGLEIDQFSIYNLPGTEISFISSESSLYPSKNEEITSIIDYLNDSGKQKVIDYIKDIKVNPKYKNNE